MTLPPQAVFLFIEAFLSRPVSDASLLFLWSCMNEQHSQGIWTSVFPPGAQSLQYGQREQYKAISVDIFLKLES